MPSNLTDSLRAIHHWWQTLFPKIEFNDSNLRGYLRAEHGLDAKTIDGMLNQEIEALLKRHVERGRAIKKPGHSADIEEKSPARQPDNPDVRDLCHLLRKKIGKGSSLIQIAREFTGEFKGDDRKAQSLLRQARRYAHLWRKADN